MSENALLRDAAKRVITASKWRPLVSHTMNHSLCYRSALPCMKTFFNENDYFISRKCDLNGDVSCQQCCLDFVEDTVVRMVFLSWFDFVLGSSSVLLSLI